MKREELVRYDGEWYDANIVDCLLDEKDAEIASLKAENDRLKAKLETVNELVKTSKDMYDRTIESLKASHYAEMVDAGMRERRLNRTLWLARAERAKDRATTCNDFAYLGDTEREINMTLARTWMKCRILKPSEWSKVWNNVERKCLKKAEDYK